MSEKNTGGLAFPVTEQNGVNYPDGGMTLRQYAAIKLRVPDSGIDWLDAMIAKANRDDFAGKAMQAMLTNTDFAIQYAETGELAMAHSAYELADAMLRARGQP